MGLFTCGSREESASDLCVLFILSYMTEPARTAPSSGLKIIPANPPFSNFDFIDATYNSFFAPLRRILSQVRSAGGATLVIEQLRDAADIREEDQDIRIRYPDFRGSESCRISFFKRAFKTRRGLRFARDDDFMGYVLVKQDDIPSVQTTPRVLESVLCMKRHDNNFIHGAPTWSCRVGEHLFRVSGYLYAQQNNVTNVCAHVALRSAAARFHPSGDMSYREMNRIVGIDHVTRKAGGQDGQGLDVREMVRILEQMGARCFVGDYTGRPSKKRPPFQKFVYGSIESGYPAIVVFETLDDQKRLSYHAVPFLGHTFNEDTWVPRAESSYFRIGRSTKYLPSESWVSMYLAHDDNWGSNFCVPRHYLHTRGTSRTDSSSRNPRSPVDGRVVYVISTFPKSVRVSPIEAEVVGVAYLFAVFPHLPVAPGHWIHRLRAYADAKLMVIRTSLVSQREYVEHLSSVRDWHGNGVSRRHLRSIATTLAAGRYWLVELSVPELFSANKRKIGEVLLRANIPVTVAQDYKHFVLARLPSYFVLYSGKKAGPQYLFVDSGLQSHVELFDRGV